MLFRRLSRLKFEFAGMYCSLIWLAICCQLALSCVHAATTNSLQKDFLEFVKMDTFNKNSIIYGFQLLERIHQVRMICEEKQNEFETEFAMDLETWTKYSLQIKQIFSRSDYKHYITDDKESIDNNVQSAFADLYESRNHHFKKIQLQCDENLESLLKEHQSSMLKLIADLIEYNYQALKQLMGELMSYVKQLQDGLQDCIDTNTEFYSAVSKLYEPNEYCYGPDINILTVFLHRMQTIVWMEQSSFFGDDEDLVDRPCGTSACGETNFEDLYTDQAFSYHKPSFSSLRINSKPLPSATVSQEQFGLLTTYDVITKSCSETPIPALIPKQENEAPITTLESMLTVTSTVLKSDFGERFLTTTPHLNTLLIEQDIQSPPTTNDSQQRGGDYFEQSNDSAIHLTIYSFLAAGGILLILILVIVLALLSMQYTRHKLLTYQSLTKEQKIAIMKQTGYVNPTYTFFDKHVDN